MDSRSAFNKHEKEARIYKTRAVSALIVVFIGCLLLCARLVYLQLVKHQFYSTLSRQNLMNIVRLKPARGLIYDRHGVLLAKNVPTYSLAMIPEKVKHLDKTIAELQKILPISDNEIKRFKHFRYQYHNFDPIPLKLKLNENQIDRFYVNQQRFPGVVIQESTQRYYPLGDITSEVVGYVGRINPFEFDHVNEKNYDASDEFGKNGIEKYDEKQLHGQSGFEEAEINALGHIVRTLKKTPAQAGKNIYLTIDSELQKKAHQLLRNENGSIVVIQPATGEVLALVSHPSFDPNKFVSGISQREYQQLLNSPDHPLFNRAIRGQFAAGSTVKPFIALTSLDKNIITPNYRIYDPGWFQLPNTKHIYHDWKSGGHGWVNVTRAIEVSCDTFFYHLAAQLGITQLDDSLQEFGFGVKTGIDLPGESAGLIPSPTWKKKFQATPWYTGDTIETAIGQGFFLVTPIQLALATATFANHGKHFQPHLLLKTVDEHGQTMIQEPIVEPPLSIKQPSTFKTVTKAMQLVVDSWQGTARYFGKHPGFSVAAKTGTAQIYGHTRDEDRSRRDLPKRLRNNHLFIAFAPVDHPQIAVAIVVEHSAMADKMAGELFNYYFKRH